jgi:membrane protein DedA with SNARE-associated domain
VYVAMFVLAGILVGGVISFARNKRWIEAAVLAAAAVLAVVTALAWVPR